MKNRLLTLVAAALVLISFSTALLADDEVKDPSAALQEITAKIRANSTIKTYEQYLEVRKNLALEVLPGVARDNLAPEKVLELAMILIWADQTDEANAVLEPVAKGEDLFAREACISMMEILAGKKDFDTLAQRIEAYRGRFAPVADHVDHLSSPVYELAMHYHEAGDFAKAIDTVMAEVNTLSTDAPYGSFSLLTEFADDYIALDKKDEYLAMLAKYRDDFNAVVEARKAGAPTDEAALRDYTRTSQMFSRLARSLGAKYIQMDLIGKPAPVIEFTRTYNGAPDTFDGLKGKVVMIDFWANWCGPCKAAFPSMRELYNEYKDEGFVILGVTSLQGRFYDGDIRENKVDEAREIELTEAFIGTHEMTWPLAFSTRSVFDPEYGVAGIPTFALLDRNGVVRMIQVGSGPESEAKLKEIVPKLLAEN